MANSVQFMGVKLVRFGYRPRRVVKVVRDGYSTYAALSNGTVACSNDKLFESNAMYVQPGDEYLNERLANALRNLNIITAEQHEKHLSKIFEKKRRRNQREAAGQFADGAKTLGIKLTATQRRQMNKARA
jgi:hypothetical protein